MSRIEEHLYEWAGTLKRKERVRTFSFPSAINMLDIGVRVHVILCLDSCIELCVMYLTYVHVEVCVMSCIFWRYV